MRNLIVASVVLAYLVSACGPSVGPAGPAAGASAPAASATATPRQVLTLRVGLGSTPAPALPNSVLWLAKDLGFYEREGLDVTLVELQGTPLVITAMRSGDIDVGNIATSDVLNLVATKTLDLRAIHSPDSRQYFMIAARDAVASLADLKGRAFSIARVGSLDHSMTQVVMRAGGVDPATVRFVGGGDPSARATTLVAGRVDATTMSIGTWISIQNEKGVKTLVNVDDYFAAAPIVVKVDAATTKVIAEKAEQLRRFTAAIIKASRAFAQDQKLWVDAIAKRRPDLARADVEGLWPQFKRSWAVNGTLNLVEYQKSAEFLYGTDDFKDTPKIPAQAWADTTFADSVLRELGVIPGADDPGRAIR